jgi:DNA polymerase III epsilon subunit-like protein
MTSGKSKIKAKYFANHGFTKEEQALYDAMVEMQEKTDALLPEGSSRFGRKLPSVEKALGQRLLNNNIKDLPATLAAQTFKVRESDAELRASNILQDERGVRLKKVAIFYKGEIDPKDQSYDLPAILLAGFYSAKNYKEKNTVVPTLEVLREFFETRKHGERSFSGKQLTTVDPVTGEDKPVISDRILSKATERLDSLLKTRLYQIPEDSVELHGISVNKVVSSITSIAANQMLKWNWTGGLNNLVQGYTNNWIGTLSGRYFSMADYNKAQLLYWADIASIVSDIGSKRPGCLNNMLIEHFNINTSLGSVNEFFSRDETHLKMLGGIADVGGSFYSAPEHFLLSTVMQANLSSMHVVNENGEFLAKEGGVTTDKKSAMTMIDAYSIVNGKLD